MNTLSWPTRAVVCRKDGSYILYNYSGGFSWYLYGPDNRLQYDIAGTLGNGAGATSPAPTTRTPTPTTRASISTARVSLCQGSDDERRSHAAPVRVIDKEECP
jgi:hypothetical protein